MCLGVRESSRRSFIVDVVGSDRSRYACIEAHVLSQDARVTFSKKMTIHLTRRLVFRFYLVIQGDGYDYLHAKYMYNFRNKPASKVKAGLLIGMFHNIREPY